MLLRYSCLSAIAMPDIHCLGISQLVRIPKNPPKIFEIPRSKGVCANIQYYVSASLAELASNSTNNVSESQFLAWNSNIQGSCGRVANSQRVCMEAPGGTWTTPSVTITAPTGTVLYYTTATPAYPTQSGTTESCGKYYQVVSGDDCATVNLRFGLNITQLQSLNTYLDDNCSNLWLDYDVCVAPVSAPTVSSDGSCGVGVTCAESGFGK